MSDERWIVVRNWRRFQHYRDRRPPWIKNWTGLLADQNYLALTPARRALLHGLWLLYAANDTSLRLDVELINTSLGLHAKMRDYVSLNDAGFIDIVASNALALARSRESYKAKQVKDTQSQERALGDFRRTPSRARGTHEELIHSEEGSWSSPTSR